MPGLVVVYDPASGEKFVIFDGGGMDYIALYWESRPCDGELKGR